MKLFISQQSSGGQNDPSHTQRWNSLEIVKGSYGQDDCVNDIAEVKFEHPIPIRVSLLTMKKILFKIYCSLTRKTFQCV